MARRSLLQRVTETIGTVVSKNDVTVSAATQGCRGKKKVKLATDLGGSAVKITVQDPNEGIKHVFVSTPAPEAIIHNLRRAFRREGLPIAA